jgi:Glycosyl transferase family 2
MTSVISVITPVHAPALPYLDEAHESLRTQRLPIGWEWEWLVQLDGIELPEGLSLTRDARVTLATNRASGPAIARTSALARSSGSLVRNLDADDCFSDPGALARDIAVLDTYEDIGWVTSRALDLLPDGSTVSWFHDDPPEGRIPKGTVLRQWEENDWLLPILPGTMCVRRSLMVALGGWMALSSSEDTGLLVPLSEIVDGYFLATPSLLYRKHSEQTTVQAQHIEPINAMSRRRLIVERAKQVRSLFAGRTAVPTLEPVKA